MGGQVVPESLAVEGPARPAELTQPHSLLETARTHLAPEGEGDVSVGGGDGPRHPLGLEETIRLETEDNDHTSTDVICVVTGCDLRGDWM